MRKAVKIVLLTPLCALLALILLDIWGTEFRTPTGPGNWDTESPDGRFIVTAYSNKGFFRSLIPTMPGDGGFGPGIITLQEKKTGKVLQEAKVENLGVIDSGDVRWMMNDPGAFWRQNRATLWGLKEPWKGDYVRVKFVAIWPLPSLDGKLEQINLL